MELYVYDMAAHSWSWPITTNKPPKPHSKILSAVKIGRTLVIFSDGPPAAIFGDPTRYMAALDLGRKMSCSTNITRPLRI